MDNKNKENKKKLLVVITKSNFGGAQRYVFDLARSLKDTYNVSVMLGGTGVLVEKLQEALTNVNISDEQEAYKYDDDYYIYPALTE